MVSSIDFNMNQSNLPNEIQQVNFLETVKQVEVPVYLIHGKYNMRAPLALTEKFFEQLQAPAKELIILQESAHNPSEADMERFMVYIGEIISQVMENNVR